MKRQKSQAGSASTRDFFQKHRSSRKTKPSPYICETLRPVEFSPAESKTQMWVATQMFLSSFAGMGKLLLQGSGSPCCGLAPSPPANNTWQIRGVFFIIIISYFFHGETFCRRKINAQSGFKSACSGKAAERVVHASRATHTPGQAAKWHLPRSGSAQRRLRAAPPPAPLLGSSGELLNGQVVSLAVGRVKRAAS